MRTERPDRAQREAKHGSYRAHSDNQYVMASVHRAITNQPTATRPPSAPGAGPPTPTAGGGRLNTNAGPLRIAALQLIL